LWKRAPSFFQRSLRYPFYGGINFFLKFDSSGFTGMFSPWRTMSKRSPRRASLSFFPSGVLFPRGHVPRRTMDKSRLLIVAFSFSDVGANFCGSPSLVLPLGLCFPLSGIFWEKNSTLTLFSFRTVFVFGNCFVDDSPSASRSVRRLNGLSQRSANPATKYFGADSLEFPC